MYAWGKGELEAHLLSEDLQSFLLSFFLFFLVSFGLGIVRVGFLLPIFKNSLDGYLNCGGGSVKCLRMRAFASSP